ncbi:MAG: sulfatase-like hydrolase/transferase [Desulfobulbia bacterium]
MRTFSKLNLSTIKSLSVADPLILMASLTMFTAAWAQIIRPNVVVMMVDNTGWSELGVYGGGILRGAPTPRLDKLASEGMQLRDFNVEPQCVPSRSAFMSGRFPTDQGFDEFYGILNTTDEAEHSTQIGFDPKIVPVPHIEESVRGGEVKPFDLQTRRLIDTELTEKAIDFMKRQVDAGKPFFNFIPYTQPHLPTLPHSDFDGRTGHGLYADVHLEIDHQAGRILDVIDELGSRS